MSARAELDAARAVLAHMDPSRGPDKAKADLIAVWSAVEAALRSLVGTSSIGGQALIRDARARQLLTFDQANALVAFLSVREQLDKPEYAPTEADVNAARSAFLKLDAGLMTAPAAAAPTASPYAPPGAGGPSSPPYAAPKAPAVAPAGVVSPAPGLEPMPRGQTIMVKSRAIPVTIGIVLLAALGVGAWWMFGRGGEDASLAEGLRAYNAGDRQTAAMNFEKAARAMPDKALPHVYLARMAREVGNYTVANQELQLALKTEPQSLEGRREYGSLFLAQGNYEQARTWYTHALTVNSNDVPSQGWLGCSLIRLGRVDEGQRWLTRAGNGPWSACRNAVPVGPAAPPP